MQSVAPSPLTSPLLPQVENARLEVARQKDEEAMQMLSHELKNRFVGVRGLVDNARLTVEEKAGHLLQAPHNLQEAFADTAAAVAFLCMPAAAYITGQAADRAPLLPASRHAPPSGRGRSR